MKTTFSKIASQQQQQQQQQRLPSSKSSNCFKSISNTNHTNINWYSDTNLLTKSIEEEEEIINKNKQELINNEESNDDLVFSDHIGLFESINETTTTTATTTTESSSNYYNNYQIDTSYHYPKKYDIFYKHQYKLTNLSSENLNYYYDDLIDDDYNNRNRLNDSINNWSMRLESLPYNKYNQHNNSSLSSSPPPPSCSLPSLLISKYKLTPTTSWNKLKLSEESKKFLSPSNLLESNSQNAIKLYANFSSYESNNTNNNIESPTQVVTFGQLKYRKSDSKSSIGTQYPPHLVDQSIQTSLILNKIPKTTINKDNLVNTEKNLQKLCFYKSLPDLNFLNKYSNDDNNDLILEKSKKKEGMMMIEGVFPMNNSQANIIASIEKRKTLKSIKRYRQTKQNTEPCCMTLNNKNIQQSSPNTTTSTTTTSNNNKLRYHNSFSFGFNTNNNVAQRYAKNTNSNNSSSSSSSSGYQSSSAANDRPLKSCLKRKDSNETTNNNRLTKFIFNNNRPLINSHLLFIPNCGVVFTCDFKSLKNYEPPIEEEEDAQEEVVEEDVEYYDEEDDLEEEEEEEEEEDNESQQVVQLRRNKQINCSDNDLRNKKSVSFCERISHHTITPPTSQSSPSHQLIEFQTKQKQESPLLQYNTLIKLLKENTHKKSAAASSSSNSSFSYKNKNIIITDCDNISLTSLNESPPNEFKFSDDDEDYEGDLVGNQENKLLNLVKNEHVINNAYHCDKTSYKFKNNPLNNELKLTINKFKDLYIKEKVLDNEKIPILDRLLRDNLCKIIFNLLKDNLKVKSDDLLRYEQLCLLFQLIINNLKAQTGANSTDKTNSVNESFILNEANSLQKFEAFIYFFLNFKQLSFIFQCILSDKNILNKFYDLTSTTTTTTSAQTPQTIINMNILIDNCKQLNTIKFNLKYYFYKSKSNNNKLSKSPRAQSLSSKTNQPKPINNNNNVVVANPTASPTLIPAQRPQQTAKIQMSKQKTLIPVRSPTLSPTPPLNKQGNSYLHNKQQQPQSQNTSNTSNAGFNFKTLSKKLNIKSWFTTSNGSSGTLSNKSSPKQPQSNNKKSNNNNNNNLNDPMKHSSSEPVSISPLNKRINAKITKIK